MRKSSVSVNKWELNSKSWDNSFYELLSNIMGKESIVTFYPCRNSKDFSNMRNSLVSDNTIEKLLESNSVELSRELNKREFPIYNYLSECISKGLLNVGYQFGIKRFNTMFIKWENGKATANSHVIPTATDISNACKYFYKMNACKVGFMPIVRINSDGAIIIDCVSYIPNFYSKKVEKTATASRDKTLEKISKMINDLNSLVSDNFENGILTNDDIKEIQKCIKAIGEKSENTTSLENIA